MTTAFLFSDKSLIFDNVPPELVKSYPIEETLRILGFDEKSEYGNPKRSWGPLEVIAGPWIGCWQLLFSTKWHPKYELLVPYELCIPPHARPIVILSLISDAWKSWFTSQNPPDDLQLGKEFTDRNWEEEEREYVNQPHLWADREFFRFCVSYLGKYFDWPEEDCKVEFSYADGQMKMRVKDIEVHCPARGKFNGTLMFSARQLFRYLGKRFLGHTVLIQVTDKDKVVIGSRQLDAQWVENENLPDSGRL